MRVAVRASGVGATDLTMLAGEYMFAPKIPFVGGYEIAGVVEAIGADVTGFRVGQRVAALTVYGGFAERLVRGAEHFVPIPDEVSDVEAVAVILNYVTAWQMIHRVANVRAGQTALVTGAGGGVGTALLQLLRLAGVKTYGAASARKHGLVASLGATPIDYRLGPIDRLIRAHEPAGVDFVFDAIGGANSGPCLRATRRGGMVVGYGFMAVDGALGKGADVLGSLCRCPPPRTPRNILRHHAIVSKGRKALSRRPAENLRAGRAQADQSRHRSHISANGREARHRAAGHRHRGRQDRSDMRLKNRNCLYQTGGIRRYRTLAWYSG